MEYLLQAQDLELKRLSTTLHEGVSQTLAGMNAQLQWLKTLDDREAKNALLDNLLEMSSKMMRELQWIATELYPPSLTPFGLIPALEAYRRVYTATFGIVVELETKGIPQRLEEAAEIALFRICQEALQNTAKYSEGERAELLIHWTEEQLRLIIRDDGRGFDLQEARSRGCCLGFQAMEQRAAIHSGSVDIQSKQGEGTVVSVSLPIRRNPGEEETKQ
jgi:two-component system, NarL family, sensor histidine kinase NreB